MEHLKEIIQQSIDKNEELSRKMDETIRSFSDTINVVKIESLKAVMELKNEIHSLTASLNAQGQRLKDHEEKDRQVDQNVKDITELKVKVGLNSKIAYGLIGGVLLALITGSVGIIFALAHKALGTG